MVDVAAFGVPARLVKNGTPAESYKGKYMWMGDRGKKPEEWTDRDVRLTGDIAIVSTLAQCGLASTKDVRWYIHSMWNHEDVCGIVDLARKRGLCRASNRSHESWPRYRLEYEIGLCWN